MKAMPWTHLATLVTGASAGLGEEFSRQLAARGCPLLITARRLERLAVLKPKLLALGSPRVEVVAADLCDVEAPAQLLQACLERDFPVAGLVNNAGLGHYGPIANAPQEKRRAMIDINIRALQEMTLALLPMIRQQPRGLILNVSSIAGFLPLPDIAIYAASKAFVTSWSLSLARELKDMGGNILVHTLCPGPTVSEFMTVAANDREIDRPGRMPTSRCIRYCLDAVDRGRTLCVPGGPNRFLSFLPRLLPLRTQTWLAGKFLDRPVAKP